MKELTLTNSQKLVQVDDEDFERLSKFKWRVYEGKSHVVQRDYYIFRKAKSVRIANEILQDRIEMYDHKDRNPYNNQKDNLRACTHSQNAVNTKKQDNCTSIYKGVHFVAKRNKWTAKVMKDRKFYYLGYFVNEIDAARAYDKKALELHGEFVNLNLPNEQPILTQ